MSTTIESLLERVRSLQEDLEAEYDQRRKALGGRIEQGRLVFDHEIRARQRLARMKFRDYVRGIKPMTVVTAPVIYSVIVAFALMDVMVTVYMHICFPVYGIPKVQRRDYVVMDRGMLPYLNWVQKVNCLYCSYGNGVIAYAREIAGRTEAHWCPIKHARRWEGGHDHYAKFMDYGDEAEFTERWENIRTDLAQMDEQREP
ncbi:MAG: hypothetical protein ACRBCL_06505 [Maritimibacter sp.]